ncbi:MAG TPA: chitobiase/beta-hexosaminidase C-terminal domain-containing protein [Fibrobacteria bacterium]|nr:chitobiase/beta-hexosaminidase C-terminal domain-containing protein [Fibrobacteria bacterium]
MNLLKGVARQFRSIRLLLPLVLGASLAAAESMPLVAAPVMVPQGFTGFVGTTQVSFRNVNVGKIFYTLNGSVPTNKSTQYQEGTQLTIDRTVTLKAIHFWSGSASEIVTGEFIRAKAPTPIAKFGGKAAFYPSVLCTLTVNRNGSNPSIRYTLDGSMPGPASATYATPVTINKTTTLRAYATEPGYDDSDPMQASFTLLEPVAAPVATPKGHVFQTTVIVRLKTATAGAFFRYTLDTAMKSLDTAAIVSGDSLSIRGGKVGDTTYLRVQAFKSGYPPSPVITEKYVYLPPVATPTASRAAGYFYDTATVILSGPKGASIRYVTDNSLVGTNSPDGSNPILLTASTTLKAQAFSPPQPPSAVLIVPYTLRLTPPDFDKPSQQFVASLDVRVTSRCPKSFIYYTLDGSKPTVQTGIPLDTNGKVSIGSLDETTLKAVAYKDGIYSEVATAVYTKQPVILRLSAPIIEPTARDFEDSINVYMYASESNAEIHYTTDGTDPSPTGPKYLGRPLRLDSSTVLRAQSFPTGGNLETSVVREERYVLTPSPPFATPSAAVPYANGVSVTLATRTRNGVIKYVLGNAPLAVELAATYAAGHPIDITSTTRLQAVTVLASGGTPRYSTSMDLTYEIYAGNPSDSLQSGSSRTLTGGFVFSNASASPIIARTHTTEIFSLSGFKDASLAVNLLPTLAGQDFKVNFTKPPDRTVSLYRYANGAVEFITADSQAELKLPGEYFVGTDTMPPVITLVDQDPRAGDATILKLSVKDNVANPSCEIQSPGLAGGRLTLKPDALGEVIVPLKVPGTDPKALWFRASSGDFYNTGRLPKDPEGKLYLSRLWNKLITPAVLSLGGSVSAWDMAGFPVAAAAPVRWDQFRRNNEAADLGGAVWSESLQKYAYLEDTSLIRPGMAFWLGSRSHTTAVALSGFEAGGSETDGSYPMVIHPGWNQVTSPSLDTVYWPTTMAASKSLTVYLKAPYRYVPERGDYAQCDFLEPWKGYFVNYFGARDTVIKLYTDASRRPAAKIAAGSGSGGNRPVDLKLDFGRTMPVSLAAQAEAQDGLGAEDEPDPPALKRNFAAWSQRGRRHLITDVIHFTAGEPLHWNIVVAGPGAAAGGTPGSGKLRVLETGMPAGYQAWAVSAARGLKFRLEAGTEMPLAEMAGDTLSVHAGPLEKLAAISEFAKAVTSVDRFAFRLEKGPEGRTLRLALPWSAEVTVGVWSPTGCLLASSRPGRMNSGIYRLTLSTDRGSGRAGSQIGFLRIRLDGGKGPKEFSQKVAW